MIVVVSQAWTLDPNANADAYIEKSRQFHAFHRAQPGFIGRRLLRGTEDTTHFTNLRFFASVDDYQSMIKRPGYADHINSMGEHLKAYDSYPREFMEVVLGEDDIAGIL